MDKMDGSPQVDRTDENGWTLVPVTDRSVPLMDNAVSLNL